MKGKEIIFDRGDALYYNFNKISLNGSGSYIDSPKWLKNKKATINPKIMMTNVYNMLYLLH